jgi:T-complex protein 1 subunit theta
MKKMIVNHIDKTFVTSDAATILKELEVQHPAAKMVVMASKMQEEECGDATNFVITFAGELLSHAENLINTGLHPSQIIAGYEEASKQAIKLLNEMECFKVDDPRNQGTLCLILRGSSKSSKVNTYIKNT